MAEEITVARPYAEALYTLACQGKTLERWSDALQFAASVAADSQMGAIIGNPQLTLAQQEQTFLSICEGHLDEQGKNLMRLLLENHRIGLLPFIANLFEEFRAAHDGKVEAFITSAFPLCEAEVKDLQNRLVAKYQRQVEPTMHVDPELIGGVRIVVGDAVFDASVRGQLEKMAFALKR
jgi:F-type H+-transporting ATPase subunit delta